MGATTAQKARLFDLMTTMGALVNSDRRNPDEVCDQIASTLQAIKDKRVILDGPRRAPVSASHQLEAFERFAREVLGDKQGLGNLPSIPEFTDDHTRVLVVKPEWDCNFLMSGYAGKKCQFALDLDTAIRISYHAKRPEGTYVVLCRDCEAGDEQLKNITVLSLEERGGTYLLPHELVLFHHLYEYETGAHLDPQTITFCPFTRAGGCAVHVYQNDIEGLVVSQFSLGSSRDGWRARSARVLEA